MDAGLHTRLALPDDPDLDGFDSGVPEVDGYFRSRRWFNAGKGIAAPPTYQFLTEEDGQVVGYAAVAFRSADHPCDGVEERARYLMVYVAGVHQRFQVLERFARGREGCVGQVLWVRVDNLRAVAFYQKMGFLADPGGPVQRDHGSPHLTMRKLI